MEIGDRIKLKRKEKRLTQSELGSLVNVSPQVISNWERGYTNPNHNDVLRLSEALDCSTEYLLGRGHFTSIAGKQITLTEEELKLFEELKKHPAFFNDLTTNPEKKVKELIKLYKMKKMFFEEDNEE